MAFRDISEPQAISSNYRQRWSHYLTLLFAVVGLFIGINLRDSALGATFIYTNVQFGIRAEYPQNWLIDTEGDYIFRVQNISQRGFPTTIQVAVQAVSSDTTTRYIFDALTLNRSQTLAEYNVLSSGTVITLPDESLASIMDYTFASRESDPFLRSVPEVVRGRDVLTIKRGQAVVISFLSSATNYDRDFSLFERFLESLEF
jgi:hypothetical protein